MKKKDITLKELRAYFMERGADLDELFDPEKYSRYTEKNATLINDAIEHYTEWKVNPDGGLQFVHPDYPDGILRHARIAQVRDISTVSGYLKEINELRDTDRFMDMTEAAIERAEFMELRDQVEEFVKEKYQCSLEDLVNREEDEIRSEQINSLFEQFADSSIRGGNVEFIDPFGKKHPFSKNEGYSASRLVDRDQVVMILKEIKSLRDLGLGVRSDHVRRGRGISKRVMDRFMEKWSGEGIEDIINRVGDGDEKERTDRLEAVHFMLSEVGRDKDGDMAFPHPDGSSRRITVSGLEGYNRYYENIKTLEEFIDKVKYAREHRDTYYQAYENAKEDIKNRQDKLKNKGKDKGELER